MNNKGLRKDLTKFGNRLISEGLVTGPGGNLSAIADGIVYLSPSGYAFNELKPEDYVGIEIASGKIIEGEHRPTSEFLMHLACYRQRPEIRAVIHTHPRYTLALSSSGHDIKAMCADFHIYTKSKIPHIDYITVTTPELAEAVSSVVEAADVIVLRNHGAITLGTNLKEAYYRMTSLEEGAHIQWLATLVGDPRFLTVQELSELDRLGSEQYRRKLLAADKK